MLSNMTPDELRKYADWDDTAPVLSRDLHAAADAWEADIEDARVYEEMANRNADVIDALRKQLNAKLGQHYAEVCLLTKRIEDLRKRLEEAETALWMARVGRR